MTIEVTEADIAESVRGSTTHCMVSTAISRARKGTTRFEITRLTIKFSDPARGLRYTYATPRAVADYLVAFDAGEEIRPFTFQLSECRIATLQQHQRTARRRTSRVVTYRRSAREFGKRIKGATA